MMTKACTQENVTLAKAADAREVCGGRSPTRSRIGLGYGLKYPDSFKKTHLGGIVGFAMSAPAKTSEKAICEAVRRLLESHGGTGLSMQSVAEAVGVKAPSLYKRFDNRTDLLCAAAKDALRELAELLADPPTGERTYESLERMAHTYRRFAKKNPAHLCVDLQRDAGSAARFGAGPAGGS